MVEISWFVSLMMFVSVASALTGFIIFLLVLFLGKV